MVVDTATAFVLLTDALYYNRVKRTILDLRSRGQWHGDIVVICVGGIHIHANFKLFHNVLECSFPEIDKSELLRHVGSGFSNSDGRELNKLTQWEKLHVFDEYFRKWKRIVFLDAGLRILDSVEHLLSLDCSGAILAPNDAGNVVKLDKVFKYQLSYHNPALIDQLLAEFGGDLLERQYMLNCIWIYDTEILDIVSKEELVATMFKYPCCKTNETGVMNLVFHFKYGLWREFPMYATNGKILFDWCESNIPGTTWRDYCSLKYPITITFDDCC